MNKSIFCLLLILFLVSVSNANDTSDKIRLNQTGFYPGAPKIAVITGDAEEVFYVENNKSGRRVFSGKLGNPVKSQFSEKVTRIADFSELRKTGTYKVVVPQIGSSYTFEIKKNIFRELTKGLIKNYYFQRMSTPLLPEFAGKWSRKAGHPDDEVLVHSSAASQERPEGTVISGSKGWYDAGDYNKYIVNSGITMGTLLSLYEDFPAFFNKLELNIPESGNKIPDLLDEILWNLRWMFTMQDPYDGGAYHKLTNAGFDGMVMPSECTAPRYVVQKGTGATLDLAAVMAQASRIFRKFDKMLPGLADSCLRSALMAWEWSIDNPKTIYNQNANNRQYKPEISTGAYGDNNFSDEFIWAASELYITTEDESFCREVNLFPDTLMPLPSWGNVRLLGYYSLARFETKLGSPVKDIFPAIREQLISEAEKIIRGVGERAYRTVMGRSAREFVWGSNSVAANQGILLIQVYRLTNDRKYLGFAVSNLDYLLGRNATGYSFVTGYGHRVPMNPHHRLSEADGIDYPIPGMLVGGPNPGRQDGCEYPSFIADEAYIDSVCSYASNEIAINWNAPAAYLAGALEAITGGKKHVDIQ